MDPVTVGFLFAESGNASLFVNVAQSYIINSLWRYEICKRVVGLRVRDAKAMAQNTNLEIF